MIDLLTELECDHCGDVAITHPDGMWAEDDGERCDSCGMPGSVCVGECIDEREDGTEIVQVNWISSIDEGSYCNRADCEDCAEARKEAGNG